MSSIMHTDRAVRECKSELMSLGSKVQDVKAEGRENEGSRGRFDIGLMWRSYKGCIVTQECLDRQYSIVQPFINILAMRCNTSPAMLAVLRSGLARIRYVDEVHGARLGR